MKFREMISGMGGRLGAIALALTLAGASAARADDWPQWRGPNRDGQSAETGLLTSWPPEGPRLLWTVEGVGLGWSSPAIVGRFIYITGVVAGTEFIYAYGLDGQLEWKEVVGPAWMKNYPGSRYTPAVSGSLVYTVTGRGLVAAFDAKVGAKEWAVDIGERFKAAPPRWGYAEGLLADGDNLICTPGGPDATMAAINRHTGETVWTTRGLSDDSAYAAPLLIKNADVRLLVTVTSRHVVGVEADTGRVLWRHPFRNLYGDHPITPIYHEGRIYVAAGYGMGGVMLKLAPDSRSVSAEWTDPRLDSLATGAVLVDGYIYGSGDRNPNWVCLEWATGKVMWEDRGIGRGCVAYADGMLYGYSQNGAVGLVKPSPKRCELVSAFAILKGMGQHWAHPVIAGGRLYIRHGDTLMAYDIRKPGTGTGPNPNPKGGAGAP